MYSLLNIESKSQHLFITVVWIPFSVLLFCCSHCQNHMPVQLSCCLRNRGAYCWQRGLPWDHTEMWIMCQGFSSLKTLFLKIANWRKKTVCPRARRWLYLLCCNSIGSCMSIQKLITLKIIGTQRSMIVGTVAVHS
jgi:hypothetical protein